MRAFSFLQESQRYVNYSKDRFGGELTFILPQWIYRVREDFASTIDSQTGLSRSYIHDIDGQELWKYLTVWDRTIATFDRSWRNTEIDYLYATSTDEGEKLKPEEARGLLPNDIKTELCMTGYIEDFTYIPSEDTPEKAGFFSLRCAKDAHPDMQILANDLKQQFIDTGLYNLK